MGGFKRRRQKGGDRKMRKDLVPAGGLGCYKIYNSILTILVNTDAEVEGARSLGTCDLFRVVNFVTS